MRIRIGHHEKHEIYGMKTILYSLVLLVLGFVGGSVFARYYYFDRLQRNLLTLSADSLTKLDQIARHTPLSGEAIDARSKDNERSMKYYAACNGIRAAVRAGLAAATVLGVEQAGWDRYRPVLIGVVTEFAASDRMGLFRGGSDLLDQELKRTRDWIERFEAKYPQEKPSPR